MKRKIFQISLKTQGSTLTVDEQKNERLLQDIANENSSNEDLKNFFFVVRGPLWDNKVVKIVYQL